MTITLTAALSSLPTPLRALVVGGTGGIGHAIAQHLSTLPSSHITISGRKPPTTAVPSNVLFKKVDASSMRGVKAFCAEVAKDAEAEKLDVLVLTQGMITMQGRTPTEEGIDIKMCLHYYSRMLIIRELLNSNSLSPKAIVITVLDGKRGDPNAKDIDWDNMDLSAPKSYGVSSAAHYCICYSDIMVQDLATTHPGPTFVHAYPGLVKTDLFKNSNFPAWMKVGMGLLSVIAVTPAYSAEKIVVGAVEAWKEGKGWRCLNDKGREVKKEESKEEIRKKVRDHTWALVDEAAEGGVAEAKVKKATT